jgi:ABC-type transport system substrate-binding protein/DNA-binding SARP family transcriptional activator
VELRLLGPLEVHLGDGPVELGPRKQRAVLAMLALEAGRTVSVDRLAEGLWAEAPPASAPKMVQLYVSHLRRILDGGTVRIVTRGRGYELQLPDAESVDVARFERLLETRPRDALALWRGEALADLADEPFAAAEIRRLEELRLRATELAIDADLAAGRQAEVIGELDALVDQEPLRERLHAQRMLALYRSGRQADALEAYRVARAALVEQIGVEPSAELRRLQEAILAQDPALDLPVAVESAPRASTPDGPRARTLLFVAAAVLLAAGVLAFGVIRVLQSDGLPGIDEDAVGLVALDSGRITDQYRVGHNPEAVAAGAGSVWVANRLDGTVTRIDRDRASTTIDVGGEPSGLAFGAGSLWVADGAGRKLAQIAPQTNTVVHRIEIGNAAHAVTYGYGAVWVASAVDATVVRIDAKSGRPGPPIRTQARPSALAAGAGAIWVASDATARVVKLDPRSGTPLADIRVGNGASGVAVGAGAVWVANRADGTLSRIDPDSEVTETVRVGREPQAVAVDGDGVWVANAGDGRVVRLDSRGRRMTRSVDVRSSPAALAVVAGAVWTTAVASSSAHRGGTLRVTAKTIPAENPPRLAAQADPASFGPLLPLVYDGLVAYRHAGGSAGGTLVADLARELPEPSRDGRTYRFRLRPDVRFSNGALVRPADVRASLERAVQSESLVGYLPIRGAAHCSAKRCDLARGIETDAAAGTVTIHLSRPDVDFLRNLPVALVVPAASPRRLVTTEPLPGTGPYAFERWVPRRGGLVVRNPHFKGWSPDRPDGFPDQISLRYQQPRAQVQAVDRGAADVALLDFGTRGLTQLRTRYGARLHSDPAAGLAYVWLNVRAPPFDDARVRRALNYAVDRRRVAELLGGRETMQPTCQMLPPGFQGYTPSCPYTANPNPAGIWTGPDLARARRLVAASGTRGMRVSFWNAEFPEGLGRYFRSLLNELGYRAELRTFPDLTHLKENAAGEHAQLGIWGWLADSPAAFSFLKPLFSCSGGTNLSRFCEPRLDAQMERAATAGGPQATERWRRVEVALAAHAPTVPLTSGNQTALTGERVGNYQHHPTFGPLLDQLWVK